MDLNGFRVGLAIIFTCLCARVSAVHCCAGNNGTTSLLGVQIHECTRQEADSGIHVNISCPHRHVLVDIVISVGISERKCVGTSLELIALVNNECYWQQSCKVTLPRKPIVCNKQNTIYNCPCLQLPLLAPDMIRVDRAKCAPSKYVKDLACEQRGRHRNKKRKAKKAARRKQYDKSTNAGIIRSHQEYPWDYKRVKKGTVCSFNIEHKKQAVVMETVVQSICEFDKLSVIRHSDSGKNINQEVIDNIKIMINETDSGKVKFSFKRRSAEGCGGFIICYKVTDSIRRQDVCEELMVMDATLNITSSISEYIEYCTDNVTDACCGETSCGGFSKCDFK
ncbi:uncharacterized protein LOC127853464 [Dreissena polymorpha]|uniref:Uncharacterized protein n=1 Tax=Dreissena polymorpha TaxID=45954 RepID=A0A9D4CT49_DREPO|nr:uncharacterized protein LOC127853464 [Dreissena polymorpha]KAH3729711.1 hypothetical protein DPMN_055689 [Dreissena polymorpha]